MRTVVTSRHRVSLLSQGCTLVPSVPFAVLEDLRDVYFCTRQQVTDAVECDMLACRLLGIRYNHFQEGISNLPNCVNVAGIVNEGERQL